jgi:hypothetical protein
MARRANSLQERPLERVVQFLIFLRTWLMIFKVARNRQSLSKFDLLKLQKFSIISKHKRFSVMRKVSARIAALEESQTIAMSQKSRELAAKASMLLT